jgi:hypothetical protein
VSPAPQITKATLGLLKHATDIADSTLPAVCIPSCISIFFLPYFFPSPAPQITKATLGLLKRTW